jgi:hypothetical protein
MLAFGLPAPEGVAEEVEAGVLRLASAFRVLAVHDLRLVGVQFESNGPEPLGEVGQQMPCLTLGCAMDDRIIRIALERTARILPDQPLVERVVHEEVGQHG